MDSIREKPVFLPVASVVEWQDSNRWPDSLLVLLVARFDRRSIVRLESRFLDEVSKCNSQQADNDVIKFAAGLRSN